MVYGAGRGQHGVVLMTTFGTGIGTAVFLHGQLLPNTEFGHIEIDGKDAEKGASEIVREKKGLSWAKWAKRVDRYLRRAGRAVLAGHHHHRRRREPEGRQVHPAAEGAGEGRSGDAAERRRHRRCCGRGRLGGRHPQRRPPRDEVAAGQARRRPSASPSARPRRRHRRCRPRPRARPSAHRSKRGRPVEGRRPAPPPSAATAAANGTGGASALRRRRRPADAAGPNGPPIRRIQRGCHADSRTVVHGKVGVSREPFRRPLCASCVPSAFRMTARRSC